MGASVSVPNSALSSPKGRMTIDTSASIDIDDDAVFLCCKNDESVEFKVTGLMQNSFDYGVSVTASDVQIAQESWNKVLSGSIKKFREGVSVSIMYDTMGNPSKSCSCLEWFVKK